MAEQLHTFVIGVDDMGATALNISMQRIYRCVVSVLIGLVYYFVAAFHRAQLANAKVLFEALELL